MWLLNNVVNSIWKKFVFREEKDVEEELKSKNQAEISSKAATSGDNEVAETTASTLGCHDDVTAIGDACIAQDVVKTPTTPDVRARSNSSSSELLSPMHDHTYALPSLLITPTMMATMDSHSLSHKGYTCLSKIGQISAPPPLPPENNSLRKSVEFLIETHKHLGTWVACGICKNSFIFLFNDNLFYI